MVSQNVLMINEVHYHVIKSSSKIIQTFLRTSLKVIVSGLSFDYTLVVVNILKPTFHQVEDSSSKLRKLYSYFNLVKYFK